MMHCVRSPGAVKGPASAVGCAATEWPLKFCLSLAEQWSSGQSIGASAGAWGRICAPTTLLDTSRNARRRPSPHPVALTAWLRRSSWFMTAGGAGANDGGNIISLGDKMSRKIRPSICHVRKPWKTGGFRTSHHQQTFSLGSKNPSDHRDGLMDLCEWLVSKPKPNPNETQAFSRGG